VIVDFHTHVFPPEFIGARSSLFSSEPAFASLYRSPEARLVEAKDLLRVMDEDGVHKAVIFGFPWDDPNLYRRHNDYIMEAVERDKDRFVGFCAFSPLSRDAPSEAERCLRQGLSGVGELAVYQSGLTNEVCLGLKEVMDVCAALDAPILLHANEPVGHEYAGKAPMTLGQIYHFLKTYPLNRIVLAHWGGGIFFYTLMKKEVRDAVKNVWFDTAASPYLYDPRIYKVASELVPDKVLFGSDYPLIRPSRYLKEIRDSGVSHDAFRLIAGHNAAALLRITPTETS
jgi:predicted TIM-barrel fold metal-dependent hydrolase